jgi:hypothetical protein
LGFSGSALGWVQNKEVRFNAEKGRKNRDKFAGT